MSLESDLLIPERQGDDASPADVPEPQQAVPVDDDEALTAELEKHAVELPEGEKLVPLSAVTTVRQKLRETRTATEAAKAETAQARADADRYQQAWQDAAPIVQAAQALLAAQQQQPVADQPDPLAEKLARILDLYTQDGQPDATRGKETAGLVREMAAQIVDQKVAPIYQQSVQQQSSLMLGRALQTKGPHGQQPNPEHLRLVWSRLDPTLTATQEGAIQAWAVALGYTAASSVPQERSRGPDGKFAVQPPGEPLFTEPAGGRVEPGNQPALNEMERKAIKDLGITETEYRKAYNPPWRR